MDEIRRARLDATRIVRRGLKPTMDKYGLTMPPPVFKPTVAEYGELLKDARAVLVANTKTYQEAIRKSVAAVNKAVEAMRQGGLIS